MNVSNFFLSPAGAYAAQSFCHALISVIIVESAIRAWGIYNPRVRQRFRFIVIVFPIISLPTYLLINPARGSVQFRLEALFDFHRWLNWKLYGAFPFYLIFLSILILTTAIFVLQEVIPILRHTFESVTTTYEREKPDKDSVVYKIIEDLPFKKPDIYIIRDSDAHLFSGTGRKPEIVLTTGLIESLTREQLRVALAHELAHISRSKRPFVLFMFLFRVLLFFNPVTLIEFRQIVQEEEKICDDLAVSVTQKPKALADTLRKLYDARGESEPHGVKGLSDLRSSLEDYSHHILIGRRIQRLERERTPAQDEGWTKFIFTLSVIVVLNYYIV
jgi:Zn-dependent protease with chaperone function